MSENFLDLKWLIQENESDLLNRSLWLLRAFQIFKIPNFFQSFRWTFIMGIFWHFWTHFLCVLVRLVRSGQPTLSIDLCGYTFVVVILVTKRPYLSPTSYQNMFVTHTKVFLFFSSTDFLERSCLRCLRFKKRSYRLSNR